MKWCEKREFIEVEINLKVPSVYVAEIDDFSTLLRPSFATYSLSQRYFMLSPVSFIVLAWSANCACGHRCL